MNIPEGWKIIRSESYGTLFKCPNGHPVFVEIKDQAPCECKHCTLAAAPTLSVRHRVDCSVVCLASQNDGIICPHDSCDIEDGTRGMPIPQTQEDEPAAPHISGGEILSDGRKYFYELREATRELIEYIDSSKISGINLPTLESLCEDIRKVLESK